MKKVLNKVRSVEVGVEVGVGIDPCNEPQSQLDNSSKVLSWFADSLREIQLIAVLNPDDLSGPGEIEDDEWVTEVKRRAIDEMQTSFKNENKGCSIHFDVIIQKSSSRPQTVQFYLEFATEKTIDLVIVHSQTKLDLASIGSFCSGLVTHSLIPILIIPREGKVRLPLRTIEFPTDFSGLSRLIYETVVERAIRLKAAVRIYHRLATPIGENLQIALLPIRSKIVRPSDIVILNEQLIEKKARAWIEWSANAECKITFTQNSEKLSLSMAIVADAEQSQVDLIALPTHTSELNIPSLGGAVDHVLRASPVPVLVIPVRYRPPGDFPHDGN